MTSYAIEVHTGIAMRFCLSSSNGKESTIEWYSVKDKLFMSLSILKVGVGCIPCMCSSQVKQS